MIHENFKYLLSNSKDRQWGLTVTTAGTAVVDASTAYPSASHPKGYVFDPEKGRTLHVYALVYITFGEGALTTRSGGRFHVRAGDIFLLFPDEWHTYHPSERTGWTEYWIAFSGHSMDRRFSAGFFPLAEPVMHIGVNDEMIGLFRKAIETAAGEWPHYQQMLAGIVDYILGLVWTLHANIGLDQNCEDALRIRKSCALMRENVDREVSIRHISEELGLSYETFRKQFRNYVGMSPLQYFLSLKIERAKELLTTTRMSIKEIAYSMNFDSPDYFCSQFRRKTGRKPSEYRPTPKTTSH
jgi:AraC-like DNA-binding protein